MSSGNGLIKSSISAMSRKKLHPYQKARLYNLEQIERIFNNMAKKRESGVISLPDDKVRVFKLLCIKTMGCSFRKLKEYCEDLDLAVAWDVLSS